MTLLLCHQFIQQDDCTGVTSPQGQWQSQPLTVMAAHSTRAQEMHVRMDASAAVQFVSSSHRIAVHLDLSAHTRTIVRPRRSSSTALTSTSHRLGKRCWTS